MTVLNIDDYIKPGRRAHLVGVGGVSMSPLAEVLHGAGMVITGSDMHDSATVEHLRSLGIHVTVGHRAENVAGAELVIRTAAVHDVNPEIAAAREAGLPCSQQEVRRILAGLDRAGLVRVSRGRGGTRLTPAGRALCRRQAVEGGAEMV